MAFGCAILECCDSPGLRAVIYTTQSNYPTGGITQGGIYNISIGANNSQCFTAIYVNTSSCSYSGTYGYTVKTTALVSGGAGFNSCVNCYDAFPKAGDCTDVLDAIPVTPTPTVTLTNTPSQSAQPTLLITTSCCDGTTAYFSTYDSVGPGNTVVYNNECYQFAATGGPGGPLVNKFVGTGSGNCAECIDVYPCPTATPTPSVTPSNTPPPTPTVTPSTSNPTPPTQACCYSCTEYVFENNSSFVQTIEYTDCYGKDLIVNIDPSSTLFLCVCNDTDIIVSDGNVTYGPLGVCTPSCIGDTCTSYTITNTDDITQNFVYTECFSGNNHNNSAIFITLASNESVVVCSCTVPENRTGGSSSIVGGEFCQCEQPPATPTPSPTGSNTPTPEVTPTNTPSPTNSETPTPTPTHTPTHTITPTHTVTPTETLTNTPTITQTLTPSQTCPQTTQYIAGEVVQGDKIRLNLWNDPGLTNQASALCDYQVEGYMVGDQGFSYTGVRTFPVNDHQIEFNFNAILPPGEVISYWGITNVDTSACDCPVDVIFVPPSPTPTQTQTLTPTPGSSVSPTPTYTQTPTVTAEVTPTQTQTVTSSPTLTPTHTPSVTPGGTPDVTPTQTQTFTPTPTFTMTVTPSQTQTFTPTPTLTMTMTDTPNASHTPTPTPSVSSTQTPTFTPTTTVTPSITSTLTSTPTLTNSVTPTHTVTNTATPSQTASSTPIPTNDLTATPGVSQTPTPTPSATPQPPSGGSVTFRVFDQVFNCNTVRKLVGCDNSTTYYVSDYLSYDGTEITTGMTFIADIVSVNGAEKLCLYYESDVDGSSTSYITQVYSTETNCDVCEVPVTPTPTPSPTLTPTMTPTISVTPSTSVGSTPTPSPSRELTYVYAYVECQNSDKMIVQTVPVPGVTSTNAFKFGLDCWRLYGTFALPWTPPSIYNPVNFNYNFFGTSITLYNDCASCNTPPLTPSITPSSSSNVNPRACICNQYQVINTTNQTKTWTYKNCITNSIVTENIGPYATVTKCACASPLPTGQSGVSFSAVGPCNSGSITPPQSPTPSISVTPSPSPALTCYEYQISNYQSFGSGNNINFTYYDCNGVLQEGSVMPDSDVYICASQYPNVPSTGVVTNTNAPC